MSTIYNNTGRHEVSPVPVVPDSDWNVLMSLLDMNRETRSPETPVTGTSDLAALCNVEPETLEGAALNTLMCSSLKILRNSPIIPIDQPADLCTFYNPQCISRMIDPFDYNHMMDTGTLYPERDNYQESVMAVTTSHPELIKLKTMCSNGLLDPETQCVDLPETSLEELRECAPEKTPDVMELLVPAWDRNTDRALSEGDMKREKILTEGKGMIHFEVEDKRSLLEQQMFPNDDVVKLTLRPDVSREAYLHVLAMELKCDDAAAKAVMIQSMMRDIKGYCQVLKEQG